MISRIFKLSVFLQFGSVLYAEDYSDAELLTAGRNAFQMRSQAKGSAEEINAFRIALDGLSDEQQIKAIGLQVLAFDEDPDYTMKSSNSMVASYSLGKDPGLITDWTELGRMIQNEESPRKFYLLSSLATSKRSLKHNGFIAERMHMLFRDGRVAKDEGEYTQSFSHDVSVYAYEAIVDNLRVLGAEFIPPAKDLPHEEKALILAKWLKGRWPGCEKLKIPDKLLDAEKRPEKRNRGATTPFFPTAEASHEGAAPTAKAEQVAEKSHWPWVIGGAVLLSMMFILRKALKTRCD